MLSNDDDVLAAKNRVAREFPDGYMSAGEASAFELGWDARDEKVAALEAENARLRKVCEAAVKIDGYRTDTRDFARLDDALREARDEA